MRHRHRGCGPRGQFGFNLPEGLMAMPGGRGWQGHWGPFTFDFGDEGSRHGGRGRRGRRMFESGELRLVLLKLISDAPRHGYNLIREIEELTGGEYAPSPGIVYPTLSLLADEGYIEQLDKPGVRQAYGATDEGRAYLEENRDEVEALLDRLRQMKPSGTGAGPAIGRAVKNLMTALTHRVGRDGLDEELLHEIAAILDEAAQRIERVK
jgi:DNA-binding PadR family transcriptional regulator